MGQCENPDGANIEREDYYFFYTGRKKANAPEFVYTGRGKDAVDLPEFVLKFAWEYSR